MQKVAMMPESRSAATIASKPLISANAAWASRDPESTAASTPAARDPLPWNVADNNYPLCA